MLFGGFYVSHLYVLKSCGLDTPSTSKPPMKSHWLHGLIHHS